MDSSGGMESLASQISANPALAKMLSEVLEQVARSQRETATTTKDDTDPESESLTFELARLRRSAERHDLGTADLAKYRPERPRC